MAEVFRWMNFDEFLRWASDNWAVDRNDAQITWNILVSGPSYQKRGEAGVGRGVEIAVPMNPDEE